MNSILFNLTDRFLVVYIDNIVLHISVCDKSMLCLFVPFLSVYAISNFICHRRSAISWHKRHNFLDCELVMMIYRYIQGDWLWLINVTELRRFSEDNSFFLQVILKYSLLAVSLTHLAGDGVIIRDENGCLQVACNDLK